MKALITFKALAFSLFLLFTQDTSAIVFEVTTPEEFQAALTAAASNGGSDEILLDASEFIGNFYYLAEEAFDLVIRPKDATGEAILNANGKSFGLFIRGDFLEFDVLLERLNVKNAIHFDAGGGIRAERIMGKLRLKSVTIDNCYADSGAALWADEILEVELIDTIITKNSGAYPVLGRGGSFNLEGVTIEDNDAKGGGRLALQVLFS
jgi:hypothetical protein